MKKYIGILFFLTALFSSTYANFLVISPEQVAITSEGMFVALDETTFAVESLHWANDGCIVAIPKPMLDICPNCGKNTYTKGRYCSNCGFPDDAKKTLNPHASFH